MFKGILTALVPWLCLMAQPLPAQPLEGAGVVAEVRHTLSFPRKNSQYVHVSAMFAADGESVELAMPSWAPGSYLIRDFAAHLENLQARSADGRSLAVHKLTKNRWRIDTAGAAKITVDYDVWAAGDNVTDSWIDSGQALLNGTGVFLYSEASRALPQRVDVQLPGDWPAVHTSLPAAGDGSGGFLAADYDELVDSPIVAGDTELFEFKDERQSYALVMASRNPLWDGEAAAADVEKIVRIQQAFWGVNPFDRPYLFINLYRDKLAGLEHDHSTVMMCNAWQMRDRHDYIKWLALVSHEFFHSWNVRRMRPEALTEYDYDAEVYTRELWLAEGLTSYYDNLLLFRAGLIDVADYLDLLAEEIRVYESTPGREVRSAELASFDTWIKQYRPDGNSINSNVSYYHKGAMVGFVSDMAIRRATSGRSSLDDVMREMYRTYGPKRGGTRPRGYPPGAFEHLVEAEAGADVRQMVEDMLRTTQDPPIDEALEWYGLLLDRDPDRAAAEQAGGAAPGGLGVKWDDSGIFVIAEKVVHGHPAAAAGVVPGDELIAIDGMRVTAGNYLDRLSRLRPGDEAELTLSRHERLLTLRLPVGHRISGNYNMLVTDKILSRQKKRLEAWLGRDLKFVK